MGVASGLWVLVQKQWISIPGYAKCTDRTYSCNQGKWLFTNDSWFAQNGESGAWVFGEQVGADMEKVNEALKIMPLEYLEMDFGDTAFFHCNTLHASAANLSDKPRWSIITAYNLASNKPYKDVHASSYTPINPFKGDLLTQDAISITNDAEFLIK